MKKIDSKIISFSLYIFLLIFGVWLLLFNTLENNTIDLPSSFVSDKKIETKKLYLN